VSEFALENLMFLEASSEFISAPTPPGLKNLYLQYIAVNSDKELNVGNELRQAVADKVASLPTAAYPESRDIECEEVVLEKELLDKIYLVQHETYEMLINGPLMRYRMLLRKNGVSLSNQPASVGSVKSSTASEVPA